MNQQDQFETNHPTNQSAIQSSLSENAAWAEPLADLPLTVAQAEGTKAGDGTKAAAGEFPYIVSFQRE